jgi:DNA-directed RNA polymerase specialized sigma24 family protein
MSMTALTDRNSLIIAAQGGNEISLNLLLKQCRTDVLRYAQRHCEMSEVDDAVQETLLIVARHIRSLKVVIPTVILIDRRGPNRAFRLR